MVPITEMDRATSRIGNGNTLNIEGDALTTTSMTADSSVRTRYFGIGPNSIEADAGNSINISVGLTFAPEDTSACAEAINVWRGSACCFNASRSHFREPLSEGIVGSGGNINTRATHRVGGSVGLTGSGWSERLISRVSEIRCDLLATWRIKKLYCLDSSSNP